MNAQPIAETVNKAAATSSTFFLPYLSLIKPANETPTTQPTKAELTYQPSMAAFSPNCERTIERVPEITAVS